MPDDIECHLVMCLTKPRLSYNGKLVAGWLAASDARSKMMTDSDRFFSHCFPTEDCLTDAKGECVICLEDLCPGDIIARLPCLCIYHKG